MLGHAALNWDPSPASPSPWSGQSWGGGQNRGPLTPGQVFLGICQLGKTIKRHQLPERTQRWKPPSLPDWEGWGRKARTVAAPAEPGAGSGRGAPVSALGQHSAPTELLLGFFLHIRHQPATHQTEPRHVRSRHSARGATPWCCPTLSARPGPTPGTSTFLPIEFSPLRP